MMLYKRQPPATILSAHVMKSSVQCALRMRFCLVVKCETLSVRVTEAVDFVVFKKPFGGV